MNRTEADHNLFIPKSEVVIPHASEPEVVLEIIRDSKPIVYPYSKSLLKILALNVVVVPSLVQDEDGQTWRYFCDFVAKDRSSYEHGLMRLGGITGDKDGIIVRPDRDIMMTIGAKNPDTAEVSVWSGIATFDPTAELPDMNRTDVFNVSIAPEKVYWDYHRKLYAL
ncbi:MAG: hypothetical protein M3Q79_00755 [bacterium]|nr:hypothetical protein [bacterium]